MVSTFDKFVNNYRVDNTVTKNISVRLFVHSNPIIIEERPFYTITETVIEDHIDFFYNANQQKI